MSALPQPSIIRRRFPGVARSRSNGTRSANGEPTLVPPSASLCDGAGPPRPAASVRRVATIGTPPGLGLRPTLLTASPHLHPQQLRERRGAAPVAALGSGYAPRPVPPSQARAEGDRRAAHTIGLSRAA
jgi:hypothetical protein